MKVILELRSAITRITFAILLFISGRSTVLAMAYTGAGGSAFAGVIFFCELSCFVLMCYALMKYDDGRGKKDQYLVSGAATSAMILVIFNAIIYCSLELSSDLWLYWTCALCFLWCVLDLYIVKKYGC